MIANIDQTIVCRLGEVRPAREEVARSLAQADDFLRQGGALLAECLDAGQMRRGMVQSSSFCALLEYDRAGIATRGLLSPEELTVSMANKLLQEAQDE
jgi:hypothetical protein